MFNITQPWRSSLLTSASTSTFNPRSLSGLAVWLDAQDTGTFTFSTGSDVSAWADKSGNGNNAVQAGGTRQPLYVSSGINNRPAVQFFDDATAKNLTIINSGTLSYSTFTTYAVVRRLTDRTDNERIFGPWFIATSQRAFSMLVNNIDQASTLISSTGGAASGSQAVASPTVATNTNYILTSAYTGTNVVTAINTTSATAVTAAPFAATSGISIGSNPSADSFSEPFAGHIAEVLFFTRYLTTGEQASVYSYLTSKWGV